MRRLLSVLVILCLAVGMLCIPAGAATEGYTLDASSGAVATASGFKGTVTHTSGTYSATYSSADLKNGGFYVLLSVTGTIENGAYKYDPISENSIQYIDQVVATGTAENGSISFTGFIPKSLGKDQVLLLGGKFNNDVKSPIALGVILSQGVEVSGYVKTYNPKNPTKIEFFPAGTYDTYKNNLVNLPAADAEGEIASTTGTGMQAQSFKVEGVAEGTYDVHISKTAHADYWIIGFAVGSAASDMNASSNAYTLPCGDIDGNGMINSLDLGLLTAQATYDKSTAAAYKPAADLDGNGIINSIDLGILTGPTNYDKGRVVIP